MNKSIPLLAAAFFLAAAMLRAQPVGGTETIHGFAGPNGPLEMWLPNVFDPNHPKLLTFQGQAWWSGPVGAQPEPLRVTFDYTDVTGQDVYLQPGWVFVASGPSLPVLIDIWALLPFCPPQVSIHFATPDPFGYEILGVFTHECIPEPAQFGLLAGLGLLSLAGYRHWRRRRQGA